MRTDERMRGGFALFGASIVYGTFGPLVRVLAEMFGTFAQVAGRMGLAFVLLLALSLALKKIKTLSTTHRALSLLLGTVATAIAGLFTYAVIDIKLANAVFLLFSASMVTSLLLGTFFFKETFTFRKAAALALGFAGLYMFSDTLLALSLGAFAAIGAGMLEGVGNGIRKGLKGADPNTALLFQFFANAALAAVVMLFMAEPLIKEVSVWPILALVAFATLQVIMNHLLLYGFHHFDVNVAAVILSLGLFFVALFGYVFFGEVLTPQELIGGVLIFVASVVSALGYRRRDLPAAARPV